MVVAEHYRAPNDSWIAFVIYLLKLGILSLVMYRQLYEESLQGRIYSQQKRKGYVNRAYSHLDSINRCNPCCIFDNTQRDV
jgi:hypothetical protein